MTRFEALQIIAANLPETLYDKLGVNTLDNAAIEEVNAILDKLIAAEAKFINRRAEEKEMHRTTAEAAWPIVYAYLTNGPATVKEIFTHDDKVYTDWELTVQRLQYMLLHDWIDNIEVIKNGRNANQYKLKEGV